MRHAQMKTPAPVAVPTGWPPFSDWSRTTLPGTTRSGGARSSENRGLDRVLCAHIDRCRFRGQSHVLPVAGFRVLIVGFESF